VVKASVVIFGWININDKALIGSQFTISTLIGFVCAALFLFYSLRSPKVIQVSNEVVSELKRVTWPERQETFAATIVVIITIVIVSIILGIFDLVWSRITNLIYQ